MSEYLKTDLQRLLNQIDLLIAKDQTEEVEANLYSARMHLQRALNEVKHVSGRAA